MMPSTRLPNLTQYERIAIGCELNLADGHAHQFQDASRKQIVRRLPDLYLESERGAQHELEGRFQRAFYELAGQHRAVRHPGVMLCYSASLSIDVVAAYLAASKISVGLVQPCFDNLAALLRRRQVTLVPVAEDTLRGPALDRLLDGGSIDALFVTLPNNPTGFSLGPMGYASWRRPQWSTFISPEVPRRVWKRSSFSVTAASSSVESKT